MRLRAGLACCCGTEHAPNQHLPTGTDAETIARATKHADWVLYNFVLLCFPILGIVSQYAVGANCGSSADGQAHFGSCPSTSYAPYLKPLLTASLSFCFELASITEGYQFGAQLHAWRLPLQYAYIQRHCAVADVSIDKTVFIFS